MRAGSDDHHGPAVRAGVPVACQMARSETVCNGHSRTRQIASELQILWSGKHDKPVPKLMVRVRSTFDTLSGIQPNPGMSR